MLRFAAILLLASSLGGRAAITSLTVFGDSLSDTGTIAFLLEQLGQPSGTPPPYFEGRFSNGPVYAELLGFPAEPAILGGTNYAAGGALTATHVGGPFLAGLSLQGQVNFFRTNTGGVADPDSFYVMWIGGNDVRNAAAGGDSAAGMSIVGAGLEVVELALLDLRGMGARRILVMNLPDLGRIPEFGGDPAVAALATDLSRQWNAGLDGVLAGIGDPEIELFDVDGIFSDLAADPGAFGFSNITDQALLNLGQNADEFVFWDDIHPTARVHALLAADMRLLIPEPGTGFLIAVAGFLALQRRRRL